MTELLFFMLYTGYEWIAQGCGHDSLDSVHPVFSLFEMASILAPKDFIRNLHFLDAKFFRYILSIDRMGIMEGWQTMEENQLVVISFFNQFHIDLVIF